MAVDKAALLRINYSLQSCTTRDQKLNARPFAQVEILMALFVYKKLCFKSTVARQANVHKSLQFNAIHK